MNVELELEQEVNYDEIKELLQSQKNPHLKRLPSAPISPLIVLGESPTRAKHLWGSFQNLEHNPSHNLLAGMETSVHIESVEGKVIKFTALSHNTIRGAAGGVVLLAELALSERKIPSVDINPSKVSSDW